MSNDVLLDALDRLRHTGPEFNGFLANHGPMAAEAMIRIGGANAVPGWVDRYRSRLDEAPSERRGITDADWSEHLGDERLFGDWTAYLRREAAQRPWRELLLRWWPRLLPGLAASATHGVIRTAHAVRSLRAAGPDPEPLLVDELAQGLGFWAARFQTVPGDPRLAGELDAVHATGRLPRLDPALPSAGPGVSGRLRSVDQLDGFAEALDRWGPARSPDQALDDLVGAAGRVLAARSDAPIAFCHAVTAPAAVRLVLPELPAELRGASVAASWQVVGAIVAAFAAPREEAESRAAGPGVGGDAVGGDAVGGDAVAGDAVGGDPTVEQLDALAIEHGDEHVIKLTEAAGREFRRTGDRTLLVAADRFRGRVPPA